ncbi:MAG: hypothetical protein HC821_05380, partial [Lewinella sp.]|nr:hypothetical protein [Lewinella sp.]
MSKQVSLSFFLSQFPEVELPVTIGEDTARAISSETPPLNTLLVEEYLLPLEVAEVNEEFTEFVACFQLPQHDNYVGLVYWRADLLQYHYVLVTLNPKTGDLLDRRVVAGTSYEGGELIQSSAAITEERTVYVVSGQGLGYDYDYSAS